jgi:hypothetical protein
MDVITYVTQSIFPQGKGPSIQWTRGWVDLRDELDAVEKEKYFCQE